MSICLECHKTIPYLRRKATKYCSIECTKAFYARAYTSPYKDIPPATVGAIGELQVSIDLLARGYEVFRALSPSCSCDLAVLKGGRLLRVEVRTGYISANTGKRYLSDKKHRADILATVYPDKIDYEPELERPSQAVQ